MGLFVILITRTLIGIGEGVAGGGGGHGWREKGGYCTEDRHWTSTCGVTKIYVTNK